MISVIATLLQLQCGIQSLNNHVLSYGTVIFIENATDAPRFGYFETYDQEFQTHRFCLALEAKMSASEPVVLILDQDGKKVIGVREF